MKKPYQALANFENNVKMIIIIIQLLIRTQKYQKQRKKTFIDVETQIYCSRDRQKSIAADNFFGGSEFFLAIYLEGSNSLGSFSSTIWPKADNKTRLNWLKGDIKRVSKYQA